MQPRLPWRQSRSPEEPKAAVIEKPAPPVEKPAPVRRLQFPLQLLKPIAAASAAATPAAPASTTPKAGGLSAEQEAKARALLEGSYPQVAREKRSRLLRPPRVLRW